MLSLLALASSAVWGISDFVAGITAKRRSAVAVVGWSQFVGMLVLLALVSLRRPDTAAYAWAPWAISAGLSGALSLVAFYIALSSGTMGVVAPIASLGVIVPVLGGVLTGETPSSWVWGGMALAIVGVVLASGPELSGAAGAKPVILASASAVGFGLTLFAMDRGARTSLVLTLTGMRITSVVCFAIAAAFLVSTGSEPARAALGAVSREDLVPLVFVGIADLTANALFATASSRGEVSIAAVLGSMYPVATILLARIFLNERLARIQVIGVALALTGAAIVAG